MIASLEGQLAAVEDGALVLLLHGVGLRVRVPGRDLAQLGPVGGRIRLHTYLLVRENELSLFGFLQEEDRQLFQLLLGVSGVGPRLALGLLSQASAAQLAASISSGDVARLSLTPGVGRRTAERLVVELKDKLEAFGMETGQGPADEEALAALVSLGYGRQEAWEALRKVEPEADGSEERLRLALRELLRH